MKLLALAMQCMWEDFQDKNVKIKHSIKLSFLITYNWIYPDLVFLFKSGGSRSHKTPYNLTNRILVSVLFLHVVHNPMICLCFCLSTAFV